ncbi:DUF2189 domain-containing protein [Paracoccus sp. (in: a-proteobacteria)]|uniref:DUF2189 domain-containing protein n=1 Tax=Paracoccus sp. TaxID=267 RepID=UPI00321FC741
MLEPLPTLRAPQPPEDRLARNLPANVALDCLRAGWRDLWHNPLSSLAYGLLLFLISVAVIWALDHYGLLYLLLPATAGFMIVGPFLAIGLYQKSRELEHGRNPHLAEMRHSHAASGGQLAYAGLLLCLLLLFWLRAADLLYALFFGLQPFPGADEAMANTFTTLRGWMLLISGGLVGALFAGFAFAISVFALPMLASERRDALTAFGTSFAMVTRNLGPSLAWGAIVTGGIVISALTGLLALIVVFPVLGHGTWHLYNRLRPESGA